MLAAVAAPPVALRIDPDAAEGLLGPGPEASTVVAAAKPVPPAILAQNEEFQAAAKKVKQKKRWLAATRFLNKIKWLASTNFANKQITASGRQIPKQKRSG